MSKMLSINYIILDKPELSRVQVLSISGDSKIADLRLAIQQRHSLPTPILKLEKVSMPLDYEDIEDKLRNFAFNLKKDTLRPTKKLSAFFSSDMSEDDLHLIIRPLDISLNYFVIGVMSGHGWIKVSYEDQVADLLLAILAQMQLKNKPPHDYAISKVSISINDILQQHVIWGDELNLSDELSDVFDKVPQRDVVHILIKAKSIAPALSREVPQTTEAARRLQYLRDRRPEAPSSGSIPHAFFNKQASDTRILCNRPPHASLPIPVTLLHPVFGKFVDDCEKVEPDANINRLVLRFSDVMSRYYPHEKGRSHELIKLFLEAGIDLKTFTIPGTSYEIDAGMTAAGKFLVVCGEIKNELAGGNVEPFCQAILYYLEQTRELATVFSKSVLPCLIILCVGPFLSFAGAVWNGRPNIQVLSTTIPFHFHHTDTMLRKIAGRHLSAFVNAVDALQRYYQETPYYKNPDADPPSDKIFPYPTSFKQGDVERRFVYTAQVKPSKLLFSGTLSDTQEKVYIKFVRHYSRDAHEHCASIEVRCAPALVGFEALDGGWWMVVMAQLDSTYIDLRDAEPDGDRAVEIHAELHGILVAMHQHGYVHGDVRDVNIMVSNDRPAGSRVMLVDFDWAGKIGEALYPMNVNREDILRPDGALDNEPILPGHDLEMLRYMFPSIL